MSNSLDHNLNPDIEKIKPSFTTALKKLDRALKRLKFVKSTGMIEGGEEDRYLAVYDATRIACEAILSIYGYRVKKSGERYHHKIINTASQLMADKLKNEFIRIQQMRKKRNGLEYDDFGSVSKQELDQAFLDATTLAEEVRKLITENGPNKSLL